MSEGSIGALGSSGSSWGSPNISFVCVPDRFLITIMGELWLRSKIFSKYSFSWCDRNREKTLRANVCSRAPYSGFSPVFNVGEAQPVFQFQFKIERPLFQHLNSCFIAFKMQRVDRGVDWTSKRRERALVESMADDVEAMLEELKLTKESMVALAGEAHRKRGSSDCCWF